MKFPKIAILGENPNADYVLNWMQGVEEVFVVTPTAELVQLLEKAGKTVINVQGIDDIPDDVFHLYEREGFWATVHKELGYMRDVSFAENSHQATVILLSNYKEDYKQQFTVQAVDVTLATSKA